MTAEQVTDMHRAVACPGAKKNFDDFGFLTTTLMLFSDEEMLMVIEGDHEGAPQLIGPGAIQLPAPLSNHRRAIKMFIDQAGFSTGVMLGEYWGFPEDTAKEDYARYMRGEGPPPSEHPNKVEGVFVATMCPMAGVTMATTYEIDRSGEKPVLVNPVTTDEESAGTVISSWLEELLPQRSET